MTVHTVSLWSEILGVAGGAVILLIFGILLVLPHRIGVMAGSKGHREKKEEGEHEIIAPDGYIDDFANEIEEAGGSLPVLIRIALPGIILWWLAYLILNWTK